MLWLLFRFWNYPYMGKSLQNTCHEFFAIISFALLPSSCFNIYVYFRSICSTPLLKCLLHIDTRKLDVRIVVPKLQSLILRVTRIVVLLVHCIVPNVPISSQNHKLIWITILLGGTVPQNLMSPSSVNFVIKSFQDFTHYVSIQTLNTECRSDREQDMWIWNN